MRPMRSALLLFPLLGCNIITSDLLGNPSNDAPPGDGGIDAPPPPDFPTAGLIVNYEFEDGTGTMVRDPVREMHGTLADAAMWTDLGRNGKGISMNGASPANQYVSLPSGLLAGVDDFTIAAWVKLSANPAWARIYDIGNGQADPANRFMYLTTSGFTLGGMPDGIHASSYGGNVANESVISTSTYLPTNVWKHVAITGSAGQRKLFIDGFPAMTLETGPAVAPREMEPISPNSWLGRSRFASDPGFAGTMDEFRAYSRVLTAAEIADLAWPGQDYSHWRFDESSGAAARDSSERAIPTALANGAAFSTGRQGGAVNLTGGAGGSASPHVVLSGNPLADCTTQFTISAWVRISSYVVDSRVFDFGKGATHSLFLAPTNGTGMRVGLKSPAGTLDLVSTSPPIPADSTWHHVAITMDAGAVVVLFVDGTPVRTQSAGAIRVSDFAGLDEAFLGKSRGPEAYFNGGVDELRIGCRSLTPDEIKNLAYQ
jgi:hypothetical protein